MSPVDLAGDIRFHVIPSNARNDIVRLAATGTDGMRKQNTTGHIRLVALAVTMLAAIFVSCVHADPVAIGSAKTLADETTVQCAGVVIATFTGRFYIEAEDRSSGIRVEMTGYTVSRDQMATVTGTMKTDADTGERYIAGDEATGIAGTAISPVGASNKAIGAL
jgi:hypothetical protein